MLLMVLVDFVLVGSIVATFLWFFTNRFLNQSNAITQTNDQKVEWAYAFDVHCNSFFPLFLILYIIQFFFLNLLIRHNWASLIISNSIYLISIVWYCYGTFLGFNGKYKLVIERANGLIKCTFIPVLPFLVHTELLLYPIFGFLVLFIVLCVLGINLSENVVGFYFGWS